VETGSSLTFSQGPPHFPTLNHRNSVPRFLSCLCNIYLNIILPIFAWFFPADFLSKNPACILLLLNACHIPCQSHSAWFYLPNNNWWSVHITQLANMQFSPAFCCPLSLAALFCNTPTLCQGWRTFLGTRSQIFCKFRINPFVYPWEFLRSNVRSWSLP
jgi:hypothetical protein